MNPDSNEFEDVLPELKDAFIEKFYSKRKESDIPIFKLYEKVRLKGYIFKVVSIKDNRMTLKPVRKADD